MAVVTQIQVRRGTASQWTSANPTLAAGEQGFETDTLKLKIGNGSTAWNSLAYVATGSVGTVTSITAGTGLSGGTITTNGTISIDTATTVDLSTAQTLTNKTLTLPVITQPQATPTFSANAYTLVAGDSGDILLASNGATAGTINIPTDATTNFAIGTQITILQVGTGQITVQATTSGTTTVRSTGATAISPKCRAQYSAMTIWKQAANLWYAFGDIS
jgi:hypothetical protein